MEKETHLVPSSVCCLFGVSPNLSVCDLFKKMWLLRGVKDEGKMLMLETHV